MKKQLLSLMLLLVLSGCSEVLLETEEVEVAELTTEKFSNELYGVSFDYPSDWMIESSDSEGVFDVTVKNMEVGDGYGCTEPFEMMGLTVTVRSSDTDFDEWFMDNYDEGGGLGSFGGEMEKTTFSAYPAYKISDFGFETYCGTSGYVVDYGVDDRVVLVTISANKNVPEYAELEKMLESVKLSGLSFN